MTPADLTLASAVEWFAAAAAESPINPAVIAAIIAALGAGASAWLAYRSSSKANATNDKKVDLEEHRDSISRLQAIINEQDRYQDRLRTQLDRLNNQLDSVQNQLVREMDVSQVLKSQVSTLQDQVRTLQRMVDERSPRRRASDREGTTRTAEYHQTSPPTD
jgi:septal ring factor EnvC (AmiA/AmiB activator)